jgi:hypothetical protein
LGVSAAPDEKTALACRRNFGLGQKLSEDAIDTLVEEGKVSKCSAAIVLLALLYTKWRQARLAPLMTEHGSVDDDKLWARPVLEAMDDWLSDGTSWQQALERLVGVFVVRRHDIVALSKLRSRDAWLRHDVNRILYGEEYERTWHSSRHGNAVKILQDIGLLHKAADGTHCISGTGRKIC